MGLETCRPNRKATWVTLGVCSVQVGLGQGREGLGSRVTGWDEDHTRMTILVTDMFHMRILAFSTSRVNGQRHGL